MISRRELLKSGLRFAVLAPVSFGALQAMAQAAKPAAKPAAAAAPALKMVPLTDPVAMALKYNPDAAKVDKKIRLPKMGVPGDKQFCNNCQLYNKLPEKVEGAEAGKCTMIAAGAVKSEGWCTSWIKKA